MGSSRGLERSLGGVHGNPLQCSCLENPTDRGGWWATVHVTESATTELTVLLNRGFFGHVCNPGLSFLRNRRGTVESREVTSTPQLLWEEVAYCRHARQVQHLSINPHNPTHRGTKIKINQHRRSIWKNPASVHD